MSESDRITGAIAGVRAHGYDIVLKLDATIGLGEARCGRQAKSTALTTQDRRFLESLRIQVDQESFEQDQDRKPVGAADDDAARCAIFEIAANCHGRYRNENVSQNRGIESCRRWCWRCCAARLPPRRIPRRCTPIIVDTAVPIIVNAVKPKPYRVWRSLMDL